MLMPFKKVKHWKLHLSQVEGLASSLACIFPCAPEHTRHLMCRSRGTAPAWAGHRGAALAWPGGEGCELLHRSLLPHTVPLAPRKDHRIFVREIRIIGRGVDVREERMGGGESKDNTISHCSMNVSRGPFNFFSSLSSPSHALSRQLERELEWGDGDALGGSWMLWSMWSKTRQLGKKQQERGHNSQVCSWGWLSSRAHKICHLDLSRIVSRHTL